MTLFIQSLSYAGGLAGHVGGRVTEWDGLSVKQYNVGLMPKRWTVALSNVEIILQAYKFTPAFQIDRQGSEYFVLKTGLCLYG